MFSSESKMKALSRRLCVQNLIAILFAEDDLAVESRYRLSIELDYLIYNNPLGYADLILNGDTKEYLKNVAGSHGLED